MTQRSKYHHLYKREQEEIVYNKDDQDVGGDHPIVVKLPSVESFFGLPWDDAIQLIDGYGLPPERQKFDTYRDGEYLKEPETLSNIDEIIRKKHKIRQKEKLSSEDYWEEIESNPVRYKKEINYIKSLRNKWHEGYWCFINGVPTYIDGYHFSHLTTNPVNNKSRKDRLPDYRDVDRRIYVFLKWALTTTESPFKYVLTYRKNGRVGQKYFNNKTAAEKFARTESVETYYIEDEGYVVDLNRRTVFGVVFPKRRRVGATFMYTHAGLRIAMDTSLGAFAIQALTEDTAVEDVYQKKLLGCWRKIPWYMKPLSNPADTSSLIFNKPGHTLNKDISPHNGWVIPRSSANKAFDGNELHAYINDESGKKVSGNVVHEFTDTIKNALAQGLDIHGFAMYTSTFGEFETGGGRQYFDLCMKSINHKRNDNGHTQTGLVTLMLPAYDGMDGKIDEFGYSVIEDPPTPVRNHKGVMIDEGAKTMLLKNRAFYEEMKDWAGLDAEIRNNPFNIREASRRAGRNNYWDITIIKDRKSSLKFGTDMVRDVNLAWSNGKWSSVIMIDGTTACPGKWRISVSPMPHQSNQYIWDEARQSYAPHPSVMGKYILGADPFYYDTKDVSGKKKSNGAGTMYMPYDALVDTPDKHVGEIVSGDFVATYNNRVDTTDEYCEDMLLAAVLWGSLVNTERNVDHVIKHFRNNKASAYLMHMVDPITGKLDPVPGVRTSTGTHEKIFAKWGDYVKLVGARCRHVEILEQLEEAKSFSDMNDLDLIAAGGMALLGAESRYPDLMKNNEMSIDGTDFIEMYD